MLNIIRIIAAMLIGLGPVCASALADTVERPISIPAGDLHKALQALMKVSGAQLMYDQGKVEGVHTRGVKDAKSPEAAVAALLEGTRFKSKVDATGAILIVVEGANATTTSEVAPADQMRLAAADNAKDGESSGSEDRDSKEGQQITVKGERDKLKPFSTGNLDLTRTEDDVLPFQVFTAREIELSGASNLQEFLQNRLPQNFNASVPDELDGGGTDFRNRANRVDMRGWGATETVYLLNGRRMNAEYQAIQNDYSGIAENAAPSLKGIPLGSIDRIEILSSAGSAIYGANATGGVINIITRQDFQGGQLAINYETPSDVYAPKREVEFSYGLPLKWGASLRFSAGYSESEPLHVRDRSDVTIERWRRLVVERQPTRLINVQGGNPFRTSSQPFGATPNIRATTTTITAKPGNLFADLPGAQASNFTTVPTGYMGGGGLAAFQSGIYNLELADGAAGSSLYANDSTFGVANTNTSFRVGLDKTVNENWRWSVDCMYIESNGEGQNDGSLSFIGTGASAATHYRPMIPSSAPTNPFGQNVLVNLVDPKLRRPELKNTSRNVTWELSSTLAATMGEWRGFIDVSYSHNRNSYVQNLFWEPDGGWWNAFLTGTYNPFVDVRTVAAASSDFYENYISQRIDTGGATRNYQSAVKASGPILHWPAGALQLTAGGEWSRSDRYRSSWSGRYQDALTGEGRTPVGTNPGAGTPIAQEPARQFVIDSYAGYVEVSVPLISSKQDVPLVEKMELFGSERVDYQVRSGFRLQGAGGQPIKYTDNSNLYALGLRYEMLEGVAFRASRSVGFKPPNMSQVTPYTVAEYFGVPSDYSLPITDPRRNNEGVSIQAGNMAHLGNPDMKPETSTSTNVGFIFTSHRLPGLRLSVDYLESIRDDAIYLLSIEETLALEAEFPGRVRRGAPDGHPSGVGPVTSVDWTYVNLNQIASKGLDISVEQQLPGVFGGRLVLAMAATKNLSFKVQATPSSPSVEQVRNTAGAFSSNQIEWNANGQLRWEGRQWGLGWSTRYYDYILARPGDTLLQGNDRTPWKLNHDVNVNYHAPTLGGSHRKQWLLSDISISLGVKNVFDRKPRFWAADTQRGVAPYDSIMGRSVWLQMRKSFSE